MFCEQLELILSNLSNLGSTIFIWGDLNVDVRFATKETIALTSLLLSFNLYCVNKEPTRASSCLDNVITSLPSNSFTLNAINLGIADHLALEFFFAIEKSKRKTNLNNQHFPSANNFHWT
jgi:hypothetical protein